MNTITEPQTKMTKVQKTKKAILKPIVDNWNECCEKHLDIEAVMGWCFESDTIRINTDEDNFHGCILSEIAGICNAYHWSWAIYDNNGKMYISI